MKVFFFTAEKGGVAKAKGEGETQKDCTTECKSRGRRDDKAPRALNYGSGEGGGDGVYEARVGGAQGHIDEPVNRECKM